MSEVLVQNLNIIDVSSRESVSKTSASTKINLYGISKVVTNDKVTKNEAYIVDTKASFVRTPDGVVHRKEVSSEGVKYAPDITQSSYNGK